MNMKSNKIKIQMKLNKKKTLFTKQTIFFVQQNKRKILFENQTKKKLQKTNLN